MIALKIFLSTTIGKYVAVGLVVSALLFAGYTALKTSWQAEAELERAGESQSRIERMERNNEKSRALSEIERCRALAGNNRVLSKACE
jgi:hypothetical protein